MGDFEPQISTQTLDPETFRREMDRIREEEVLTEVELHENRIDELHVEGLLAFAEHLVLNARRLWSPGNLPILQGLRGRNGRGIPYGVPKGTRRFVPT